MDKNDFKKFCFEQFKKRGFVKHKNMFYRQGKDVLCGLLLQKSDFGPAYYINYYFYIGVFNESGYPTRYDLDVQGRVIVLSKKQTIDGENFSTSMIHYEEYSETELIDFFDKAFEEFILPPIFQGKKYILNNLNEKYFLTLRKEEVMSKLK